ncbi:hypothetical protein [Nostoc sp. MG11]|nr:hypothetical protein [Nostoc sp. MG11]
MLSIAIQEKLRKNGEEKEYQEWKQQVDIATTRLEKELRQDEEAIKK